jgi:hypothetical protein
MRIDINKSYRLVFLFEYGAKVARNIDTAVPLPPAMQSMIVKQWMKRNLKKQIASFAESIPNLYLQFQVLFIEDLMGMNCHFLNPLR